MTTTAMTSDERTKQGVPDLNKMFKLKPQKAHVHKLIPETYQATIRIYGKQQTIDRQRMVCYCGHVEEETNNEGAL